jgi:Anti-sigma-K factor rskA, C-terminal/Putative zinc-finger
MSDIHALSGAYAVDALDDVERAHFERHLAECETCRAELDSLQDAAGLLAETTAIQPPAGLRDSVLAGIATVRPLPPEVDKQATVTELAPRRRRRTTAWLAAAAAVIAIGGGAVVWQQAHDEGAQSQVEQIQAASDVQRYTVPLSDGGSATIYRSKKLNEAAIVTQDMPAAPAGHDYVLWLQHGEALVPAGVMPEGADNAVVFSGDAASASGAGITVEEAGTEPTRPSEDVVALVAFDA